MNIWGFGDEAVATLIVGFVTGILIPIGIYYFQRRRPSSVYCKQVAMASLVNVNESVRERIKVHFDGTVVKDLSQTKIQIENKGHETIKPMEIKFVANPSTTILDVSLESFFLKEDEKSVITSKQQVDMAKNEAVIALAYMNASEHKQVVFAEFICDGPIDEFSAAGGGEGWSLKYESLNSVSLNKFFREIVKTIDATPTLLYVGALLNAFFEFVLFILPTFGNGIDTVETTPSNYVQLLQVQEENSISLSITDRVDSPSKIEWETDVGAIIPSTDLAEAIYIAPASPESDLAIVKVSGYDLTKPFNKIFIITILHDIPSTPSATLTPAIPVVPTSGGD